VVDEVLGDEGELGEVAEDRLRIEGGRSTQRRPHSQGANDAELLMVVSERRPTVWGGGPSSGGARGSRLGVARPALAGVEAHDAAVWRHRKARCGALRQLRACVRERGESCGLLRLEQREDKAQLTWGRHDRDAVSRARDQ
jgi:hypothetical protein